MSTQLAESRKKTGSKSARKGQVDATRITEIVIDGGTHIPAWVTDLDSFRRWAFSDDYPERGKFCWLAGKLFAEVHSELLQLLSDAAVESMRAKAFKPLRSANGSTDPGQAPDILIDELVRIPGWVRDLDSFRRWAFSDDFPEHGQFSFLAGKLWVDLCMETDFHNQIKTVITIMLGSLVLSESLGRFYTDGMLLSNSAIGLSNEPDAMFISNSRLKKGLAVLKEGGKSMEVTGAADMALEVISRSSVKKDTVDALHLYAKAGVREYWLVDSTIETPELGIMRLVAGKYVTVRKLDGWVKSNVFGRSFRLTCKKDAKGMSHFNLETK